MDWPALIPYLGPAAAALARYDGMLAAIPHPRVLLAPLTTQEAVLSSRIEGTQATMGEVLELEAGGEVATPERRDDIQEVLNYRAAMRRAEAMLEHLPLSQRVIREAHQVLLSGVRGMNRSHGEYRRVPNWIGPPGCSREEARFVPIDAAKLPDAIGTWERFIHEHAPDRLVQLALLHAEFEALHPFLDGNGRLGRMLVPLFLWQQGLIGHPVFYISGYFEARREAYYDRLLKVSRDGDWSGWCVFFLEAVRAQAEDNLARVRAILALYQERKGKVASMTRSPYAIHALDWIFSQPIFSGSDFGRRAGISTRATAKRMLAVLREAGILMVLRPGKGRKSAILAFPRLLEITEGGTVR